MSTTSQQSFLYMEKEGYETSIKKMSSDQLFDDCETVASI